MFHFLHGPALLRLFFFFLDGGIPNSFTNITDDPLSTFQPRLAPD